MIIFVRYYPCLMTLSVLLKLQHQITHLCAMQDGVTAGKINIYLRIRMTSFELLILSLSNANLSPPPLTTTQVADLRNNKRL